MIDLNQYANAIASIESAGSGDYQAVGPRTRKGNRAYGRYQVMDFNIGPWTEKYLGQRLTPEQFLESPEAQDAVFQGEFGSYINRYGNPQDAASAWFTGQPMSQGAGRSDILGTTGAGYVQKFNAALGQPQGGDMQPTGLLGTPTVSTQGQAPEQERQPFFRRPGVGDFFDRLAIGLQGMTLNPNQALIQASQGRIQQRREAAQTEQQRNRTVEALKQMGADPQLIQLAQSGYADAALKEAILMRRGAGATSKQRDYQYLLQQGVPPEQAMERVFGRGGTTVNIGSEVGTIPQGYELFTDPETGARSLRPIPGGPAEAEQVSQEESAAKREQQATRAAGVVLEDIDRLQEMLQSSGLPITGAIGGLIRNVPGTRAYDASALVQTIAGNIGFDRLQQMREASPTGGALGAVSERELSTLQSVLGSLDQAQSQAQFERNLQRLEDIYVGIMQKASAYPNAAEFGFNGTIEETSQNGAAQIDGYTIREVK